MQRGGPTPTSTKSNIFAYFAEPYLRKIPDPLREKASDILQAAVFQCFQVVGPASWVHAVRA